MYTNIGATPLNLFLPKLCNETSMLLFIISFSCCFSLSYYSYTCDTRATHSSGPPLAKDVNSDNQPTNRATHFVCCACDVILLVMCL